MDEMSGLNHNHNPNANHSHNSHENSSSYLRYSSSQPLVENNSNRILSQSSHRLDDNQSHRSHSHINQSLPPMSSFVATNSSQSNSNETNGTTHARHHQLLTNSELSIELLTNQTSDGLDNTYNSDALDPTFVDALNISQFVFDPFLSDGQSIASHVSNESEETYYTSDLSHIGSQTGPQSQQTAPFGQLTMSGPHISDIFSVLDSLTETDALTETLLNVNDHYCNNESLVPQNQNLNNAFLPQNHEQMQTIQITSNLAQNHMIANPPQVQLTPIVLSRPALQTQPIITQPMMQTNNEQNSDNNRLTNHTMVSRLESNNNNNKQNKSSNAFQNGFRDDSLDITDLIEETKCFKCIICNFISLEKSMVSNHINEKHKNEIKATIVEENNKCLETKKLNTYMCSRCYKGFPTLMACRQHMVKQHNLKVDNVTLQTIEADKAVSDNDKNTNSCNNKNDSKEILTETHDNNINKKSGSKLRHILPNGKIDEQVQQQPEVNAKKNKQILSAAKSHHTNNNNNNNINNNNINNGNVVNNNNQNGNIHNNHMTAKRIAWKKKLKREQGSYICEFKGCSVRFRALENLQRHHKCHSDSGSGFVCCNCNKGTEQWPSMAGHLWRSHGIDLELHACEHCSYRTYSLSILENIHKRIHSNEKNFLCDTCGKGFKNCKQLINHKVKHVVKTQVLKTHECHICLRTFTDARTKRVHLNTVHNKTRPYICSHCNHSAASRSALRTHMRQHTGEKPFKCDKCNYSTSDHNSLRRHKMRHSGERPYKCPFCVYACIQSSTYKQHLKNKHPGLSEGIMFNCEFCGYKTVNQDMYATHISEHNRKLIEKDIDDQIDDMGSTLVISPDSPTLQFACIVGQSISSQNNTPTISYASDFST